MAMQVPVSAAGHVAALDVSAGMSPHALSLRGARASAQAAAPPSGGRSAHDGTANRGAGTTALPAVMAGVGGLATAVCRRGSGRVTRGRSRIVANQQQFSEKATWTGLTPGKEYQLQTLTETVAADTTTIRSLDWDRDRFDIEFALERGTTYNSYVIKGADKVALVDTSHQKFDKLFFEALDQQVDYATLAYLIVSHTEPDHSGLIFRVLEKAAAAGNTELTVVGSKVCIQFLENLCFTPFKSQVVANNAKIDLGGGHELEFVIAPNLHWPDTMFTFDHGTGLLYTCDAFGMHYCSENIHDVEEVKELLPHYSLYYECLMKPNARSVLTALKKTAGFDFHTIATGHGPMLSKNTAEWVDQYKSWSEKATKKLGPSVAIFWVSSFGESERVSQVFAHGVTSSSVSVEMHDLKAVDAFEITECLARSDVLVVTAPPQGHTACGAALGSIIAGAKEKKHSFLVLDSCSEEEEPVDLVRNRFVQQGIAEALPALSVTGGSVTAQLMQAFEEFGMKLGSKLTQKTKAAKAKSQSKDLERALGRLSSSLYVVTAKKSGVRHAMVASWVTPASQSPLGISLAVAKDRAMEPLLRVGDTFNLNLLEEGNSQALLKHFLQRFQPGADRLAGVDCFESNSGAAVLRDACGYLECRIMKRMDVSDHNIAYAEIIGGSMAKAEAEVAVHHRKNATYY